MQFQSPRKWGYTDIDPIAKIPLIERYAAVWIWMGDPARADPTLLPEYRFLEEPGTARIQGYIHTKANYELMSDNIMDLSHVDFLHGGSLGCGQPLEQKLL